jgi:hypothetical protein
MTTPSLDSGIDAYLRERLTPVEGAIPHLRGIEMYGDTSYLKSFWFRTRRACPIITPSTIMSNG